MLTNATVKSMKLFDLMMNSPHNYWVVPHYNYNTYQCYM